MFLNSEVSRSNRPGTGIMFRPAFPKSVAGAGKLKHWVLMKCKGLPVFRELQPGTTLGRSKVEDESIPTGSPPICGVNGVPVLARTIAPHCHPPSTAFSILGDGSCQM